MRYCKLLVVIVAFSSTNLAAQLTYNELVVSYDSAWTFKNLKLIPIRYKARGVAPVISNANTTIPFAYALQKHKIRLQEMQYEQGADVNWLQVSNHSKQNVLVQAGEVVSGGKQDRMIAETKILEPGKTDYIHVYCIEKRRWDDKTKDFIWKGVANSELRKTMDRIGRQSEVWREIDRQFVRNQKTSETYSYLDLYNNNVIADTSYINYFRSKYAGTDSNFAGYIFITGEQIISCELFASAEFTNLAFNNMLNSYVHSVLNNGSPPVVSNAKVKEFVDKVISNEALQKTYVIAHGKLHVYQGKVIHLVAYPN